MFLHKWAMNSHSRFFLLAVIVALTGTSLLAAYPSTEEKPSVTSSGTLFPSAHDLDSSPTSEQFTDLNTAKNRINNNTDELQTVEAFSEPYREIALAASEMGSLSEVYVLEGAVIESGAVVATLDSQIPRAAIEVARANMSAQGALKSAEADLRMKRSELEKLDGLRERSHASQNEVDRIQMELTLAEARLLAVREDLEVRRLELKRIEVQLEQRQVRSPIRGVVTEVLKDAGEFVSPSDPVVARIVQLDPLLVVFSVPLTARNLLKQNDSVELQIGAEQLSDIGFVEYVSPVADASNSSVRVKVRLPNDTSRWQSGERVTLRLDSKTNHNSPAITEDAVAGQSR
ncbi:MAG: efflux RND transporter periplasmic adaptor subunit [Planctomyces sp.]|nr:efflux RND transporter periplasmic adaptor subunit [Planctomyces sp.]